ncbi:VOC family protein [Hyphococcus sp. DH-69]|uniref:VOC family protein n=1 Tax=Hyphococcus formosus TaxID=3143534 RepID=UPI00398BA5AC
MKLAQFALLVPDYDEAIDYYCTVLGFSLLEDTQQSPEKRWVVVSPGEGGSAILLAKAADEAQRAQIGNQAGGRVFLFLNSEDFDADYQRLKKNGVEFLEVPRHEPYGSVVVFRDRFGNKWDLIEPKS